MGAGKTLAGQWRYDHPGRGTRQAQHGPARRPGANEQIQAILRPGASALRPDGGDGNRAHRKHDQQNRPRGLVALNRALGRR